MGMSCRDCKERHLGCHSNCEKYIKDKEEIRKLNETIRFHKRLNVFHSLGSSNNYNHDFDGYRRQRPLSLYARGSKK